MSVGLYTHTTRAAGTILTAAIYNADHQNHVDNNSASAAGSHSDTVGQMRQMSDPGLLGTEVLAPSLSGELERLRFAIARLAYTDQWYLIPNTVKTLIITQAAYDALNPPETGTLYVIVG